MNDSTRSKTQTLSTKSQGIAQIVGSAKTAGRTVLGLGLGLKNSNDNGDLDGQGDVMSEPFHRPDALYRPDGLRSDDPKEWITGEQKPKDLPRMTREKVEVGWFTYWGKSFGTVLALVICMLILTAGIAGCVALWKAIV